MSYSFFGIDHVQLAAPVGCESIARYFYGELIGLPEVEKPENLRSRGGVWFQCGLHHVHIGVDSDFVPAQKAHPAFHVRSLGQLRERLQGEGVRVRDDELLPGAERFYVDDPFGNRLEFLEWVVRLE